MLQFNYINILSTSSSIKGIVESSINCFGNLPSQLFLFKCNLNMKNINVSLLLWSDHILIKLQVISMLHFHEGRRQITVVPCQLPLDPDISQRHLWNLLKTWWAVLFSLWSTVGHRGGRISGRYCCNEALSPLPVSSRSLVY